MGNLDFIVYDPVSNTRVVWQLPKEDANGEIYFGITVRKAMGDLINAIAKKTGDSPTVIALGPHAKRFVIRIEPRSKGEHA